MVMGKFLLTIIFEFFCYVPYHIEAITLPTSKNILLLKVWREAKKKGNYTPNGTSSVSCYFLANLHSISKSSSHKPSIYRHPEFILTQNHVCSDLFIDSALIFISPTLTKNAILCMSFIQYPKIRAIS